MDFLYFWLPIIGSILLGGVAIGALSMGAKSVAIWSGYLGFMALGLMVALQLQNGVNLATSSDEVVEIQSILERIEQHNATTQAIAKEALKARAQEIANTGRPYLVIEAQKSNYWGWHNNEERFVWPFQIANYGELPAQIKSIGYGLALDLDLPPLDGRDYSEAAKTSGIKTITFERMLYREVDDPPSVIRKGEPWALRTAPSGHFILSGDPKTRPDIAEINRLLQHSTKLPHKWFFVVKVEYRGADGGEYKTGLCLSVTGSSGASLDVDEVGGSDCNYSE